jgi:hypothetical protein
MRQHLRADHLLLHEAELYDGFREKYGHQAWQIRFDYNTHIFHLRALTPFAVLQDHADKLLRRIIAFLVFSVFQPCRSGMLFMPDNSMLQYGIVFFHFAQFHTVIGG